MKLSNKIRNYLKRIPWFYFLFSIYPLLFLWANNKSEIDAVEVIRPMIFTVAAVCLLYVILIFIFHNSFKAALYGTMLLFLFFSYGQVYSLIRNVTGNVMASRHRILIVVYVLCFAVGTGLIIRWWVKFKSKQHLINILSLFLIILPVMQLGVYYGSTYITAHQLAAESNAATLNAGEEMPDVYFILLDTYMRSDALLLDMGYDNSAFIDQLRQMNFFVADCSRSNYGDTESSLISTLNMSYLSDLMQLHPNLTNDDFYGVYIRESEVRRQLENLGYITVAFRTGYAWTEIHDADIFLGVDRSPISLEYLHPFENMYLKSTAGLLINDLIIKLNIPKYLQKTEFEENTPDLLEPDFPYLAHVDGQLFVLNQLPSVVAISGPKFVFTHILIPHAPYVFAPDGSLLTDPGYYSGNLAEPMNDEYRRNGYVSSVQFINVRIIPVLQKIIADSDRPPIIVLEGDHGVSDNNRLTSLLAFYLPDGYENFYSTMTPVNSFRLILNHYFGADYSLLSDISYDHDEIVPETYPDCIR